MKKRKKNKWIKKQEKLFRRQAEEHERASYFKTNLIATILLGMSLDQIQDTMSVLYQRGCQMSLFLGRRPPQPEKLLPMQIDVRAAEKEKEADEPHPDQ